MQYEEVQNQLRTEEESLKNQYGLRFLFVSMLTLSLILAACRYVTESNDVVQSVSYALAILSTVIGLVMLPFSIFQAICVALTDENPVLKKIGIRRSLNLFIIGTIFFTPGVVILVMSALASNS